MPVPTQAIDVVHIDGVWWIWYNVCSCAVSGIPLQT